MTSANNKAKQIEEAGVFYSRQDGAPQTVKEHLISQLVPCSDCQTIDETEISNELLNSKFVIWCGCGKSTDAMDSIEEALEEWKLMNGDES